MMRALLWSIQVCVALPFAVEPIRRWNRSTQGIRTEEDRRRFAENHPFVGATILMLALALLLSVAALILFDGLEFSTLLAIALPSVAISAVIAGIMFKREASGGRYR